MKANFPFVSLAGAAESSINGEKERVKIRNGDYEFATGPLPASCFLQSLMMNVELLHLTGGLICLIERREATWDLEWQEDRYRLLQKDSTSLTTTNQ